MALPSLVDDTKSDIEWQVSGLEMTKLATARKWILGIGFWYLISGAFMLLILHKQLATEEQKNIVLGTSIVLFVVHLGLYMWARVAPFAAAITSLLLFITVHVVNAAIDPSTLYKGLVIKALFVVVLAKAIQAGNEIRRLRSGGRLPRAAVVP